MAEEFKPKTTQELATQAGVQDFSSVQSGIDTQGLSPEAAIGSAITAQNKPADAISPTVPVKIPVEDAIPEEVFNQDSVSTGSISQQILSSIQSGQQQIQTFLAEAASISEQQVATLEPGEEELALTEDFNSINQEARQIRSSFKGGVDKITGQSIPMSIAMGQTRELENQANRRLEALSISQAPIVDRLNAFQSAREVKLTQLQIMSQFARDNFAMLQSNAQVNNQFLLQLSQIEREEAQIKRQESQFALQFAVDNGVTSRFFKFPDDPTVYDLQQSGKPLTFEEYQQVTNQVGKPARHTLFDNVQTLSPQTPPGDFQFIAGTETQESGYFNKNTGEFIPFNQFEAPTVPISTVNASGSLGTTTINDRLITIDQVALPSLDAIHEQAAGIFAFEGSFEGLTIGGVETSSWRTSEAQQKLFNDFEAGGVQAAPPGFSAHESGMAVDLFPNQIYIEQMRPIMEANGWFQTAGNNDLGHFQYLGNQPATPGELTPAQITAGNRLATRLHGSTALKTEFGYEQFVQPILDRIAAGESIDEIEDDLRFQGQSTAFTGAIRDAAQQITSDWSEKKTSLAFDKLDDLLAKGDMGAVQDHLKKLARDDAGVDEQRQVQGSERTVEFINEVAQDLKDYEALGGKTNIFTGTTEKVIGKAGAIRKKELRKIATKIAIAIQKYRRAMSGVAFSVPESEEYKSIFPNIDKTSNFNQATIDALNETLSGDVDFFYSNRMGDSAYESIFKQGQATRKDGLSDDDAYEKYLQLTIQ